MPVTDLKFYWSFQHSSETTQEVRDNELRQTDFFASHGPSAFAYFPPMRQSLSRQLSDKTFYMPRPIFLHGLRSTDLSGEPTRYRSMSSSPAAQTIPHGHEKRRSKVDTCRGQRTAKLAYICRLCIFLNPDCQKTLQRRTFRRRLETDGLCSGCYDNRPLPLSVSLGKLQADQECNKTSYTPGFARQHPNVYPHLRRQVARGQHLRYPASRNWSFLHYGSRLSGFCQIACALLDASIFCDTRKIKFQMPAIVFSSSGSNNRSYIRPNHSAYWILSSKILSGQTTPSKISRCQNRQNTYFPDKQFYATGNNNHTAVQVPMAGRTLLQVDQAKPAHQEFLRHIGKLGENANLDCRVRLRSRCHYQKASQYSSKSLHNVTNFECYRIRQNALNSTSYRDRLLSVTKRHKQPTELIQLLTGQ